MGPELREGIRGAMRSADVRWALGLAALALALRLGFVLAFGRTVVYDAGPSTFAFNDTFFYSWTGSAITMGDGFSFLGHPTAHWPPGYSFLLAGVYWVFGADTFNALVANAVIGALTVPLVLFIGCRALGRSAGIVAADIAESHAQEVAPVERDVILQVGRVVDVVVVVALEIPAHLALVAQ